ncbi:serine hydroxymethyltransferase, partial [Patescibacteria group bacterium]|nr:serine hydroxymethyltransferase [Patescibacteria group bacterium]
MSDMVFELIRKEKARQKSQIHLIPSENFVSENVLKAIGSCLTNKYAEGYAGRRYYQGNKIIDEIENLVVEKGKELFGVPYMNVQPYSGSPANEAVLFALLEPGDKICGMKLSAGGHLTHGHPKITFGGKYFDTVQYGVNKNGKIDYDELTRLVKKEKPKLIWVGTTAYPWILDWKKFSEIAGSVGAWLIADISHIAGLVVAGVHPSPVDYVDVVTSTTHKTLRGSRGAFIAVTKTGLSKDSKLARKIDKAVFPGMQGGPHINNIAGIGVAFEEASNLKFKQYGKQVVNNAKVLADELKNFGFKVFGTENHLMLVEFGVGEGRKTAEALDEAGIIVNYNTVPGEKGTAMSPSGIRIGTPAETTRGMKEDDIKRIAGFIKRAVDNIDDKIELEKIKKEVE